jgi:hypothetical protein
LGGSLVLPRQAAAPDGWGGRLGLLLSHSPGRVIGQVTSIHARAVFRRERRNVLDLWATLSDSASIGAHAGRHARITSP